MQEEENQKKKKPNISNSNTATITFCVIQSLSKLQQETEPSCMNVNSIARWNRANKENKHTHTHTRKKYISKTNRNRQYGTWLLLFWWSMRIEVFLTLKTKSKLLPPCADQINYYFLLWTNYWGDFGVGSCFLSVSCANIFRKYCVNKRR